MLPLLLGVTLFNPAKASALDISQIPLLGSALQRGLTLEPSLRLFDQGINRNNLQVCVLSCSPMPNSAVPTPVAPQLNRSLPNAGIGRGLVPQQVLQLPNQVLQQGVQLPNQILQPNSLMQQSQMPLQMPQAAPMQSIPQGVVPQGVPQSLPQSSQIQQRRTSTLQQVGQVLQPQIMQAIGR
jgi:hypothetical protein